VGCGCPRRRLCRRSLPSSRPCCLQRLLLARIPWSRSLPEAHAGSGLRAGDWGISDPRLERTRAVEVGSGLNISPGVVHARVAIGACGKGPAVSAGLTSLTSVAVPSCWLCSRADQPSVRGKRASRGSRSPISHERCRAMLSCRMRSRAVQPSVCAKGASSLTRPYISHERCSIIPSCRMRHAPCSRQCVRKGGGSVGMPQMSHERHGVSPSCQL